MDTNPFTPNFGQVPFILAGREFYVNEIIQALEARTGHPSLSSLFVGARGAGKTALLSHLCTQARQRGWIVASTPCIPGMLEDLYQQAMYSARQFVEAGDKRLKAVSIAPLGSIEWENTNAYTPNWRTRMTALLDQLAAKDIGVLFTVDEINPRLDEMIQLASIYQMFVREERTVGLFMAGLPSNVSGLLNDESVSFLRRASQYHLGQVSEHDVESALRRTVEAAGKEIDGQALAHAASATYGFPYMIQLVGFRMWQQAGAATRIERPAVREAIELAARDMESRVLKSTLDELSEGDLRFLEAMLASEGTANISEIEAATGKGSGYVARYRRRLLDAGVIDAPARGKVAFALPGLREYLPRYLAG